MTRNDLIPAHDNHDNRENPHHSTSWLMILLYVITAVFLTLFVIGMALLLR